jgi:hypothetical protein
MDMQATLMGIDCEHETVPSLSPVEVMHDVDEIVESRLFRTSPQCQNLLRYVVAHTLEGREEELKERVIGCEVFGRPPDYNTADDPVVRSRAADVRKRLALYYQDEGARSRIRISIPSGSYRVAITQPNTTMAAEAITAQDATVAETHAANPRGQHFRSRAEASRSGGAAEWFSNRPRWQVWIAGVALAACVVFASFLVFRLHRQSYSRFATFWAPLSTGPQPPVIYVGSSAVYRLKQDFIERYQATHPNFRPVRNGREFTIPLTPQDHIEAADLEPADRTFATLGDVAAAVDITSMLAERKQPYDFRIGQDLVFGDFREAPVILIGAFNNSWTIELNDTPCFAFAADNSIRESKGEKRVWRTIRDAQGRPVEDYALISRQINSKSGKFVFTVAGIDMTGTRAAAEFVRDPARLDAALGKLPNGWQNKDLQMIVHTDVVDNIPSDLQVVASCVQ